jgi:hypothetical protein
MKIIELIEILNEMPPDAPVLIASDEEGNSYHHFNAFSWGYVEAGELNTWEPEVLHPDDEEDDEYEGDPAYAEVFILFP